MALNLEQAEPRKISDKPGFDTVDVRLSSDEHLRAWRVTFGPDRTDRLLGHGGVVTGVDRIGPAALPLDIEPGGEVVMSFTYDDTGAPPDGDYTIGCHGLGDGDWA
jgi:hypothetical protein